MAIVSKVELNPHDFDDYLALYGLLTDSYAFMEGRIDPPSFLTHMNVDDVAAKARNEDLYLVREVERPVACMFAHIEGEAYELGKVAVAAAQRRRGWARAMLEAADVRAKDLGCKQLQLHVRVELTENQETYRRLGFRVVAPFSHPGFDRPTSMVMHRPL